MRNLKLSLKTNDFHDLCELADGKGKVRTISKLKLQSLLTDHSILYKFANEHGAKIEEG